MIRKLIIIILLILFSSCYKDQEYILYKYKDIYISRVDKDDKTFLYYGKITKANLNNPDVSVSYSGFDNLMDGYMIFTDDYIRIIPLSGNFKEEINNKYLTINNVSNNFEHNNWEREISGKYENVCRISNIISREQNINNKNHTSIEIKYIGNRW